MALGGGVTAVVTDRRGGTSAPPYAGRNLALHVGDDPARVVANRELTAAELGRPLAGFAWMEQVHGAEVVAVGEAPAVPLAGADGLVTTTPGTVLTVLVADCAPVLLADPVAGVVGAAHAGRAGLALGVLARVVAAMNDLGADPARTIAHVGPCLCAAHHEVPERMRTDVAAAAPGSAAETPAGRPAVDLRAGLARQLADAGVRRCSVDPACPAEDLELYSHRRDGVTGRFAGLVWLGER
ncbi:MAG: peptidoglycan editing factor PgeF [Frankiaceae bacterium]